MVSKVHNPGDAVAMLFAIDAMVLCRREACIRNLASGDGFYPSTYSIAATSRQAFPYPNHRQELPDITDQQLHQPDARRERHRAADPKRPDELPPRYCAGSPPAPHHRDHFLHALRPDACTRLPRR